MVTPVSADGEIEIETLPPGWKTAAVTYLGREGGKKTTVQIIDLTANPPLQYWHDPVHMIARKCMGLVIGIPFFAAFSMVFLSVRTVTLVVGTLVHSVSMVWQEKSWASLKRLFVHWTFGLAEIALRGSWDVIKVPFLSVAMQLCCIYGFFSPLRGRALAGRVEYFMRGSVRAYDLCHMKECQPALIDFMTNKDSRYCVYWAYCFQPVAPARVGGKVLKIEYLPENSVITKKKMLQDLS